MKLHSNNKEEDSPNKSGNDSLDNKQSKLPQFIGLSIIIDIILLDQITKWWITEHILRVETGGEPLSLMQWLVNAPERLGFVSVSVMPSFNLSMVWNEGVSFGMLQNAGILPLVILTLVISGFLLYLLIKSQSIFEGVSYGIILGGAFGNLIDRFRFGAVADFFDVYIGDYHWPAFNIADAAIVIGVILLLIQGLFFAEKE
jgi:signal peptidase II